jgi:hypothetical protein
MAEAARAAETETFRIDLDPRSEEQVQPRDEAAVEQRNGKRAEIEIAQVNPIEVEAARLIEIDNDQKLKRVLQEWEKQFKVESLRVEKKAAQAIVFKNELYQLIGFYSVFQGVVLTAVAQTNLIKCNQSWGPSALSMLASIATLAGVCNKFNSYNKVNRSLKNANTDLKALNARILLLKKSGKAFKFPEPTETRRKSQGSELFYLWTVVSTLLLFSVITLASCLVVLCQRPSS